MTDPLQISTPATPNPNAVKFTLNRLVAASGATYRDAAAAQAAWAKELLGISGVTQVFAISNFISVTKQAEAEWEAILPQATQILERSFRESA